MSQQDNSAGRIIFLNGAPCAGKTTIARALQETLDEPYLHLSADHILGMLPQRYRNVRNPDNYRVIYKAISGMHHAVATLAAAGNNVIVDTVLANKDNLAECVFILAHFRVTFVGVFCPLEALERRERERDDRYAGMARAQFEQVHAHQIYDLEVDTSLESAQEIAAKIKAYNQSVPWPQAFRQIRNEKIIISFG
ncbi:AAA family ATPase [Chloroflexi bacterium TSY]|nr:AAA family ATPase [Chloroflexi bacterium TSY]